MPEMQEGFDIYKSVHHVDRLKDRNHMISIDAKITFVVYNIL